MDDLRILLAPAWVHTVLGGVALLAVAWLVAWLVGHVLVGVMKSVIRRTAWLWDDALI
jgi:miniconductance mechanosensitive channel